MWNGHFLVGTTAFSFCKHQISYSWTSTTARNTHQFYVTTHFVVRVNRRKKSPGIGMLCILCFHSELKPFKLYINGFLAISIRVISFEFAMLSLFLLLPLSLFFVFIFRSFPFSFILPLSLSSFLLTVSCLSKPGVYFYKQMKSAISLHICTSICRTNFIAMISYLIFLWVVHSFWEFDTHFFYSSYNWKWNWICRAFRCNFCFIFVFCAACTLPF